MARGFFGGLVIGGAVSVAGAAVLSVVAFPPSEPPLAPQMEAPAQAGPQAAGEGTSPAVAQSEAAPAAVPRSPAPSANVDTGAQPMVPSPTPKPQTADSTGAAPVAPESGAAPQAARPADEAPGQSPGATAPATPQPSGVASLDTEPAAPARASDSAPNPATAPQAEGAPAPQSGAAEQPQSAAAPDPVARPDTGETPQVSADPADPAPAPAPQPVTERPALPTVVVPGEDAGGDTAQNTGQAQTGLVPGVGRPATSLIERAPDPDSQPAESAAPESAATAVAVGPRGDLPALDAYAVPFDVDAARPLVGIVLMDQGQSLETDTVGVAALASFPYPLTFAVDVSLPDAAARMSAYRAQGFEVMALVDLPENLTGADTEVALSAALDAVPEAVGVLEGPGTGLQGGRALSDQVSAILRDTGHGIVWRPKGLDTAQKLAAREGVASQTLFRDFDSEDQTPTVIRRFLDQAAFRASQQGAVIMVGRVRPDTISALLVWGLQDRASRVAVAPVSAVLRSGLDG